jgi:uncharacterized protein YbaP (TraB family)
MPLFRPRKKEIKMIWQVDKNGIKSFLIGTAHFFPYSFRTSLSRYLQEVKTVLFEGPLDQENLSRVVKAGFGPEDAPHLFDSLDEPTIRCIAKALAPSPHAARSLVFSSFPRSRTDIRDMVQGMKYWMAFFTIWTYFLEKKGWSYSVDLEAYALARELGKKIVFLETIEEQIGVLESLSPEKIISFLKRIEHWDHYTRQYVKCYLEGNLARLGTMVSDFPSRCSFVIERRDQILYDRMRSYLEEGGVAACVGAPHIPGIREMLHADGYVIRP